MSRQKFVRVPKHCHFKARNLGVVRLDGHDHYTGRWGSPEADTEYRRLIAEWLVRHDPPGPAAGAGGDSSAGRVPTVGELILAFWDHVTTFYRRADGSATGEEVNYRYSLRPLRALYETLPAVEFSPLKLKAVRQAMIAAGLARTVINGRVGRIVRMFKWAVEAELVPETVHRALTTVQNLQRGRCEAREPEPVRPVTDEQIAAVLPLVSPQVRTMIELQRVTALRSTEVCRLRGEELDRTGDVWVYRPARHKGDHHGKARVVFIGPRGQGLLKPWLRDDPAAYLFSPREAVEAVRQLRRDARPGGRRPATRKRKPKRQPGPCYTFRTYGAAVRRACERAGVGHWHPHQIRHTRGTEVRTLYGLEGSQVALGHANAKITELYAERDHDLARRIALQTG